MDWWKCGTKSPLSLFPFKYEQELWRNREKTRFRRSTLDVKTILNRSGSIGPMKTSRYRKVITESPASRYHCLRPSTETSVLGHRKLRPGTGDIKSLRTKTPAYSRLAPEHHTTWRSSEARPGISSMDYSGAHTPESPVLTHRSLRTNHTVVSGLLSHSRKETINSIDFARKL